MTKSPTKVLFVVVFYASACFSLEYSKGNNGNIWNAWGNGNDRNINDDDYGTRLTNEEDSDLKLNFRQCVKPWQKPIMTIATISSPSQPVTCHPDYKPCEGEDSECQFSFSSFQYICCQDKDDVKPPECPKYHMTLRTFCGGINDASCPRSYKCLPSRFDPNIEICCKPDSTLVYPEPDTSFRDNFIVPEHLSVSPKTSVQLKFKSLEMAMGQLIANDDVEELLQQPPTITGFQGDESKLYTVLLFGYPRNAPAFVKQPNKGTLYWLMNNVVPFNGTLYQPGNKRSTGKEAFPYARPLRDEKPYGIHTMVFVVFEQNNEVTGKTEIRVDQANHEFIVKQWLEDFSEEINGTPVAGNFYGISAAAGYIYMLLAVLGVILNAGVLIRLIELAYNDYDRFQNGCGLPLAAMSVADLMSLMSIIVTVTLNAFFPPRFFPLWTRSLQCKVTMFLIHAMTGFSTWCWLFVSALRYMAVYHPLWQISRWKFGYGSLFSMLFFILLMNSWLLFSVVGFPNTCGEVPLATEIDINRMIHGFELFVSYILPAILTFALDVRVLFTRPPEFQALSAQHSIDLLSKRLSSNNKSEPRTCCCLGSSFMKKIQKENTTNSTSIYASLNDENCKKVKSKNQSAKNNVKKAKSAVVRWLMITTIDLLLNTPDNFLRILSIVYGSNPRRQHSPAHHLIALVARLLYFAQFCFNAFYLSTIIYKRNVESAKSRQQRLRNERKQCCKNCNCMHEFDIKCTS